MRKLLHERLRDGEDSRYFWACTTNDLASVIGEETDCHDQCSECRKRIYNALADEIERYYIPRPRFEDGEPVQFGDKALRWDGKHGNDGENVTSITVEGGDYLRYGFNGDICSSQLFKRPQPKVLDADGVEIKVGDVVYSNDGKRLTVRKLMPDEDTGDYEENLVDCGEVKHGIAVYYIAHDLTHKEPVLDADGVPINVGDTVWHTGDLERGKVISFTPDSLYFDVKVQWTKGDQGLYAGEYLTHKELDSLEKLRDDVDCMLRDLECDTDTADEIERRFSALIERGA